MLEISIVIAFTCLFIHSLTWEGMILSFIPEVFYNTPAWIRKPFYECPICMAPWWGSFILVLFGVVMNEFQHWLLWILEIAVAGGINAIASSIITLANGSGDTGSNPE